MLPRRSPGGNSGAAARAPGPKMALRFLTMQVLPIPVQLITLNDTDATDSGSRPISSKVSRKPMSRPVARGLASMSW